MNSSTSGSTIDKFTTFGDLLRFLRRRAGITQMELAMAVGYSDAQISRLEQNLRLPDLALIEARFIPALGLEAEPAISARFLELAANVRREDSPAPGLCPYKGLNYFDEADAPFFVGRENLTAKLTDRVLTLASARSAPRSRFLAVVGASGSGKSSLVRAGLVPALRWNKQSADWLVHVLVPTQHPLESLAATLTEESGSLAATARLIDDLAQERRSLQLFARNKMKIQNGTRLLLVIDQFEEVFALCRSEEERACFIDNLLTAASEPDGETIVVLTLRADFYAHCANYDRLREALAQQQEYIGVMSEEELRRAIEEPAQRGRWELEPGLVELLLYEVGQEPGSLPLLSHALLETWQRRRGNTLTLSGYTSSGGVRGAIAETAETVFTDQFTPQQQAIARRIFLRLTELGDEAAISETRRRATYDELVLRPEEADDTHAVLKALADARLITTTEDSAEVAHEALIREWPTLRNWLEDNRDGVRLHRRLTETAREWAAQGFDEDLLYRGGRLAQAREWAGRYEDELNTLERDFLLASNAASERENLAREEQRQRELANAQKLAEVEKERADEQKNTAQRLRQRAWILGGLLLVAGVLAAIAIGLSRQRTQLASVAISRELAAASISNLVVDPERSILLAIEALDVTYTSEAEEALHRAVLSSHVRMTIKSEDEANSIAFSPDGGTIGSGWGNGMIRLFHTADGQEMLSFQGHDDLVSSVAFSPDGKWLASASWDGHAKLWNALNGEQRYDLTEPAGSSLWQVAFSPDGRLIAAGREDGVVQLWDTDTGDLQTTLTGHGGTVFGLVFSADGSQLATSGLDGLAYIWNLTAQEPSVTLKSQAGFYQAAFSPDSSLLATAGEDETVQIWDAESGEELEKLTGFSGSVLAVDFSPDGELLAGASSDGTIRVWEVASGKERHVLRGHTAWILDLAFSPDGSLLASSSQDSSIRLWDPGPDVEVQTNPAHTGGITYLAVAPDGSRYATTGEDNATKVWVVGQTEPVLTINHEPGPPIWVAYSPDGRRLATVSVGDPVATIWDAGTGEAILKLEGHEAPVTTVAFSPDGRLIATGSEDNTARIWDAQTGDLQQTLTGHDRLIYQASFDPDSRRLVTSGFDRTVRTWDLSTGEQLLRISLEDVGWIFGVIFSPDGRHISATVIDGITYIWDAETGDLELTLRSHTGSAYDLAYTADANRIVTIGQDGLARIWAETDGRLLMSLPGPERRATSLGMTPDGRYLMVAGQDGLVRLYYLQLEELTALAHTRLTRSLTDDECRQYLHTSNCL